MSERRVLPQIIRDEILRRMRPQPVTTSAGASYPSQGVGQQSVPVLPVTPADNEIVNEDPGTFSNATVTVDAYGRVTEAEDGVALAFLFGEGEPDNGDGSNGDLYLDTLTGDLYQKAAGSWALQANLQGEPGEGSGPETEAGAEHNFLTAYDAVTRLFSKARPTFANLASTPTTLAGYGITDATSTARAAISETIDGITYTSGTGVFALDSGRVIPQYAASSSDTTTDWNTLTMPGIQAKVYRGNNPNGPGDAYYYFVEVLRYGTGRVQRAFSYSGTGAWTRRTVDSGATWTAWLQIALTNQALLTTSTPTFAGLNLGADVNLSRGGANLLATADTFKAGAYQSSDGTAGASAVTGGLTFKDGLYTSGTATGGSNTVLNGTGAPDAGDGDNGDFYIDTTAWEIYGPKAAGAWGSGVPMLGEDGDDGADGRTILNGTGVPDSELGADGDFYLDTAAVALYGPKTAGAWGSGTSLAGEDGTDGTDGADGKTVLNGAGAPSSGIGTDGDFYLDTTDWDIYGPKTEGAWGSGTSIIGPAGAGGGGLTWEEAFYSATAIELEAGHGYIVDPDFTSPAKFLLPETAVLGSIIKIVNNGPFESSFRIEQRAGQSIRHISTSTTVGTGGLLLSGYAGAIELVCVVADTAWVVASYIGSLTLT